MFEREAPPAAVPEPIFEIHTGRDLHAIAAIAEAEKPLFGEFWHEGETAIVIGDHGTGKSILAAQIGDRIARGSGKGPFGTAARRQKVLFLDLEQSGRDFIRRYSTEHGSHKFSSNFVHVSVDPFAAVPDGYANFIEYLTKAAARLIREHRPKVVILDSLAQLRRSNDITRDVLPLLRELGRLKRELKLSILLVAHSQRRVLSKYIEIGDMQAARGLCAFADSIFTIGVSRGDTSRRYLKQLKARRREILYDRSHTVGVQIKKDPVGWLSCEFTGFAAESEHFGDVSEHRDWKRIFEAKDLFDKGYSYKWIGIKLGVSKTTAHRLVQMWRKPEPCPYAHLAAEASVPAVPQYEDESPDPEDEDRYDFDLSVWPVEDGTPLEAGPEAEHLPAECAAIEEPVPDGPPTEPRSERPMIGANGRPFWFDTDDKGNRIRVEETRWGNISRVDNREWSEVVEKMKAKRKAKGKGKMS